MTALEAEPPALLLTVIFCGLPDWMKNCPLNFPPPLLVSVPIAWPVEVMNTVSVADELVLVASSVSCRALVLNSALVMATLSRGDCTVKEAVLVVAPKVAEIVTVESLETD